ncbi:MAG: hypothetical protein CVV64_17370 [Candidatus Wallbacteria bacterium HGW-Wallbacteria-1]|jgi:outer membrane lipoprotein-sorting protein|uniref:Uncharacterized protein n=1 Tax=Candidatus Wallbacteria bacterium HGW-Wallbacteria-1 TaxID=2013854 RepID=A0A2N1PKB7_9BACT|nr:MAG: hypothetical protein CVV64_17370 [Candidatus Wallbacteria bacterium HGW-Wallbacteria-1]
MRYSIFSVFLVIILSLAAPLMFNSFSPVLANEEEAALWKELDEATKKISEGTDLSFTVTVRDLITPDGGQIESKFWASGPNRAQIRMDYPMGMVNMSTVLSPSGGFHHIIEKGTIVDISTSEARSAITQAKAQMEALMSKLPKVDWEKMNSKYSGMHTLEKDDADGYTRYIYRNTVLINRTDFMVDSGNGALAKIIFYFDGKTPTSETEFSDVVFAAPPESVFERQVPDLELAAKNAIPTGGPKGPDGKPLLPGAMPGTLPGTIPSGSMSGYQTNGTAVQGYKAPAASVPAAPAPQKPAEEKKPAMEFNLGF